MLQNKRVKNKWVSYQKSFPSWSTMTSCWHRSMRRKEKVPKMPRRKEKKIFILVWKGKVGWRDLRADSIGKCLTPPLEHRPTTISKSFLRQRLLIFYHWLEGNLLSRSSGMGLLFHRNSHVLLPQ